MKIFRAEGLDKVLESLNRFIFHKTRQPNNFGNFNNFKNFSLSEPSRNGKSRKACPLNHGTQSKILLNPEVSLSEERPFGTMTRCTGRCTETHCTGLTFLKNTQCTLLFTVPVLHNLKSQKNTITCSGIQMVLHPRGRSRKKQTTTPPHTN